MSGAEGVVPMPDSAGLLDVGASPLRARLEQAMRAERATMGDLTVLAPQNDPFRLDTPANHCLGVWLADQIAELLPGGQTIHIRGLHYVLIGRPKPDGNPYTNTDGDWNWLAKVTKAARFLGYVPWTRITDQRNTAPVIRQRPMQELRPYVSVDLDVMIPYAEDLHPQVSVAGFQGVQPYRLAIYGEKSSLEVVLGPIAQQYDADLYLPTGEISDTQMYLMASAAAADDRPLVVVTFSDCDPAGWSMPISISRKLQAFQASLFPDLEFEVHRAALTPDQVREHGLPSTPLKDTERRADRWREAMGVEQTEIDALGSLQPDVLRQIARDALAPYFDDTLSNRVWDAKREWIERAQEIVDAGTEALEGVRAAAVDRLDAFRAEADEIMRSLRIDADAFELPDIEVPEPELTVERREPLIDSCWSFGEQCRRLRASKAYEIEDAA